MRRLRGPLLAGIASGVVAILALVLLVLPKMGQVGKAREELTSAQQQETSLETQLASLQEAKQQAPQIQEELDNLKTQIPPTADLPEMIRLIAGAADRSAVDFFSIAPTNPTTDTSGEFSIVPAQITMNGDFFSLEEFLYRIETLPRATKVVSFTVAQGPGFQSGGSTELTVTMTAEFYTTDASAGPGSSPGPTEGTPLVPGAAAPVAPPSPGA